MSERPIVDDLNIEDIDAEPEFDRPKPTVRRSTAKAKPKPAPPYREGALIEPLARMYATMGVGLMPLAPRSAGILIEQGETCAEAWDQWAKTSPAVRRMLYPLLNVSAGAAVFAAHLPILLAVVMEMKPGTQFADTVESYLAKITPQFMPTDDSDPES